jgi:radical SAM protein with 4Fe4S-binding SPASM domain
LNPDASMMMAAAITNDYRTVLYTTLTGFGDQDVDNLKGYIFDEVFFHQYEGKNFDKEVFERKKELFKGNINSRIWRESTLDEQYRYSRASNLWNIEKQSGMFSCVWSEKNFSRNVVLPNGDVYLCCMDYSLKHKIGNLFESKYEDLDRQKIIDLSNMEDSDVICRKCELFRS